MAKETHLSTARPSKPLRAALLVATALALALHAPVAGAAKPSPSRAGAVARTGVAKPVARASIPSCRAARRARSASARRRARQACARRWRCRTVRVSGRRRSRCTPRSGSTGSAPRPAAPSSAGRPIPDGAQVHWNGDFSTGSWSQWDSEDDDCESRNHAVVAGLAPPGLSQASRHTVTSDSTLGQSGARCLVYNDPKSDPTRAKSHAYAGAEAWYEDWMYFPADFVPAPRTDWNWVWQLHNWPDDEGPVNIVAGVVTNSSDGGPSGGERLSLRVIGGASPRHPIDDYGTGDYDENPDVREKWLRGPDIERGRWHHVAVRVKWSRHAAGLVEYWLDGARIGAHEGPNLFYHASGGGHASPDHAGQAYYSVGYYRSRDRRPPATVYHAGTRVHRP